MDNGVNVVDQVGDADALLRSVRDLLRVVLDCHRHWRASRECLDGRSEAFVAEKRWVDPSGELAELSERTEATKAHNTVERARKTGSH